MAVKGDFTDSLGRIYGIYVGGFAVFVIAMAILEQLGLPEKFILWAYMGLTILVYAFIGVMSRTSQVSEYYVAGRAVPAVYNGTVNRRLRWRLRTCSPERWPGRCRQSSRRNGEPESRPPRQTSRGCRDSSRLPPW